MATQQKHTVLWIDHDGEDCETQHFSEWEAIRHVESLEAEGLTCRYVRDGETVGSPGDYLWPGVSISDRMRAWAADQEPAA